jgi:hypothetical protein
MRTTLHATAATFVLGLAAAVMPLQVPVLGPAPVHAQFERVYHPMHLPASHNWQFRAQFPALDRLFAAFDYGHGILYETLYTRPAAPAALLEEEIYRHLVHDVLRNPPRMHMPERSFMPRYARLVPRAKEMFEWAHVLHRQAYDILADDRVVDKDAAMDELLAYYMTSPLAFSDVPKGMAIMDEQHFSQEFRARYPRFNGLIWAYHWLQVAVHEPLLAYETAEERQAAMQALLARFWQMLEDPPHTLPSEMPMTAAIAPRFTERFPRFAAVFDNLHMMHDVISDILVSDRVTDKRAEIYRQAHLFRDPESMAVSHEEWIAMAIAHGLDAQGGPALGILPPVPTRDVQPHDHPARHGEPEPREAHRHAEPEPRHDHPDAHHHAPSPATDTVPAHHRVRALILGLVDDDVVRQRIHDVPELHESWEDDDVQRHIDMMRRMQEVSPPEAHQHEEREDHRPIPEPDVLRDPAHQDAAMHRVMEFVLRLVDDPRVRHRIHEVPEFHSAWEDAAVQDHLQRMRDRHGAHPPHHPPHP